MLINLVQMKFGESGIIIEIQGGFGIRRRLETLGIIEGVRIKRLSSQFIRGPVVIEVRRTRVGIGSGMARRILVEVEEIIHSDKKTLESELEVLKNKKKKLEKRLEEIS